ncbi:hypothetical protein C8Q74DRAFT_1206105 [Fomes fomentarius]|nr:hypothetical protein C8Q74DRAFT_1206105 [Fomes fomentarius]
MDSVTSKSISEQERQAQIRRQIALLQAQLDDGTTSEPAEAPPSPKRKRPNTNILVPETPSTSSRAHAPVATTSTNKRSSTIVPKVAPSFPLQRPNSAPTSAPTASSTVLQKLAQAHSKKGKAPEQDTVARSNSFAAKPPSIAAASDQDDRNSAMRDDNLALIEDIPIGPADHKPPFDDPHFEKLEPNSGIRLSSRSIPHEDFQDYLRGRYYLSPSKLYSVVRLLPSKQGYDVPVCGDWLTIAVVAERGKIKYTQAPVGVSREDKLQQEADEERMDELPSLDDSAQQNSKPPRPHPFQKRQKPQEEGSKPSGKKYVNIKLIDFGCRSRGSSADGGKAKIRGDAFLSLLLFESDAFDVVTKEDGTKQKIYRGGSRGAFERMSKLREGAVVALLNPKILKPFQRSTDKPHPTDNILALTPESDASTAVIGYAQDLGMCRATKRDGTRCSSWCDKRVSDVCEFHIQSAVQRQRAARPEFASGTGGMTTTARKKPVYDPARQWGLKPEGSSTTPGATYVVSGHVISGSTADPRNMYIGEQMGREAQAKAARKLAADSDKALQRLLARDREGTKAVSSAREFMKRKAQEVKQEGKKAGKTKGKGKSESSASAVSSAGEKNTESEEGDDSRPRKNAYSAELIKQLGFDPTAKDGRTNKDANAKSKLDALAALQTSRKIQLGPRPGKSLSCVLQPEESRSSGTFEDPSSPDTLPTTHDDLEYADEEFGSPLQFPDSDDDDLEREEVAAFGRPVGLKEGSEAMIDLDDSDVDL